MGLGALLTRNLQYVATNTATGETATYTVITDGRPGMYPDWSYGEYRGLMSIPASSRAMTLIAGLLGRVPWVPYREVAGRAPVKLTEPVPLLSRPTAGYEPKLNTYRSWGLDRLAHGNAIGIVSGVSSLGWPSSVLPVCADYVGVRRADGQWEPTGFTPGEVVYSVHGRLYPASQIVHFKGPCKPGDLRGMSVVEQHFATIERSRKLDAQVAAVSSAAVPSGVIKTLNPDLTQAAAQELKDAWLASQATRTVAVLGQGVEFEPVAWNPTEIQLNEMRQYSTVEWANIFGIDVSYLGGQNPSRVYANIEDKGIDLLKFGNAGDLIAEFEATLTEYMPRGQYVKANLDFLLRADTTTRYQAHAVGIAAGFLHPDEAREYEERPPLTPEQKADLAALRAPAGGAPSTAPAGKGAAKAPGSGAALSSGQGSSTPRLSAVRGLIEHLEPLAELERAADPDGSNLHEYWTAGPGLAQWASSPTPWRTLRGLLAKYLSGEKLDATTSAWYRDVFGQLPMDA